jgi:SAM-dependent methyltransferase
MTTLPLSHVACPVCGSSDSRLLRAASYPEGIGLAQVQSAYCASSDHALLDAVVKCRACGMVYVNPRLDAAVIQGGYEAVEDPVFVQQNPQRIRTFARVIRSILRRTGLDPAGKRLLDVGCAGGAFPEAARAAGFAARGVEPSRWLSDYGRTTYGIDVVQGILLPGMFADREFDVITMWDVIEHLPDPHDALTTIHSLLKPGGYLWVNYPDIGGVVARLLGWRWPFWLSVHLHYYTRNTMRRQLEKAGFSICYMRAHWQELQLGYVLQRAASLLPPFGPLSRLAYAVGVGKLPITYNIGQTLVVARRNE